MKKQSLVKSVTYIGDEFFLNGLKEIQQQLNFQLGENGVVIKAVLTDKKEIRVTASSDTQMVFTYYDKASFFHAFSLALQSTSQGKSDEIIVEPYFDELGTMLSCQNTILSVTAVKELIRSHALMGYTYIQLYLENGYEIVEEPYFGYKKGRYSLREMQEIVAYSEIFGIEMIPCIQTLGHMHDIFNWGAFGELQDIAGTMLVNFDKTYQLVSNMIKSMSNCFKSSKINLGMDEAYFMGLGRYHWFIDEGAIDRTELFIKHLDKVIQIAAEYGFTSPSIWYDNIFAMNYKGYNAPPEWLFKDFDTKVRESFPQVKMIFWHYVLQSTDEFVRDVGMIKQLSTNVSFASMAHGYTSFSPANYLTEKLVDTALQGCKSCGIKDLMVTWWGSKISPFAVLPSFYNYSEKVHKSSGVNFQERCKFLFGYDYNEFSLLDAPSQVGATGESMAMAEGANLPLYALANDPLFGTLDCHIPDGTDSSFAIVSALLKRQSKSVSPYSYIFKFEAALCDALSVKAELGKKLYSAYRLNDKAALADIADGMPQVIRKIDNLYKAYREYFLTFAKPEGLVSWDFNFGGVNNRLKAIRGILKDFLSGKIEKIAELEEERLPFSPDKNGEVISFRDFVMAATGI